MGILLIIGITLLCGWVVIPVFRNAAKIRQKKLWLVIFLMAVVGIGVGMLLANLEYHAGAKFRVVGTPIPLIFFHLENGQWVDFPLPSYVAWPGYIANVIFGTALCLAPLRFTLVLQNLNREIKNPHAHR